MGCACCASKPIHSDLSGEDFVEVSGNYGKDHKPIQNELDEDERDSSPSAVLKKQLTSDTKKKQDFTSLTQTQPDDDDEEESVEADDVQEDEERLGLTQLEEPELEADSEDIEAEPEPIVNIEAEPEPEPETEALPDADEPEVVEPIETKDVEYSEHEETESAMQTGKDSEHINNDTGSGAVVEAVVADETEVEQDDDVGYEHAWESGITFDAEHSTIVLNIVDSVTHKQYTATLTGADLEVDADEMRSEYYKIGGILQTGQQTYAETKDGHCTVSLVDNELTYEFVGMCENS